MNSKLILVSLVLTACSTSTLDTSINNNDSGVEQRTKRDSKNINSNSSNVVVNATAEPVIEVRSGKIADRADPNTLFKNYSIYFDLDEYTVKEDFRPLLKQHAEFLAKNPNAIINGRLAGYGDYVTPEQNIPVTKPSYNWWELCMTINNNWGFQFRDTNWKKPNEIITLFADVIGNGGNLLLDIGPREDGTIPKEQRDVLTELGKWNRKHDRAVFGSLAGIPKGHFYGPTTISKDSTSLYLFLQAQTSGPIMIKGLVNRIKDIKVVGRETSLPHKVVGKISWSPVPGLVFVDVPRSELDPYMTVLELKLEGPVKLYAGHGGFN